MTGTKQRSCYRKSRKGTFFGKRKHDKSANIDSVQETSDIGEDTSPSTNKGTPVHSPPKKNRSLEKIASNCPLAEKEESQTSTRRRALALGYICSTEVQLGNGNNVINSSCLQEALATAAVCSSCKSTKGTLQLLQDNSKRKCLHEIRLLRFMNCQKEVP